MLSWKRQARAQAATTSSGTLLPRHVAALHGLSALHQVGIYGRGETIGFVEFARPNAADDAAFWRSYSIQPALNTRATATFIDRSPSDPTALGETDLDLQYAGALAPAARLRTYIISDQTGVGDFLGQMYDALYQAAADGVRIVSISLGTGEAGFGSAGPIVAPLAGRKWTDASTYAADLDTLITDHGMCVFAAAGDSGAYGGYPFGDSNPQPIWPAIQSSVVAVGGTQLEAPGDLGGGEQAWGGQTADPSAPGYGLSNTLPNASGGGGASAVIAAPGYQSGAGSGGGRATPDIAAFSGPLLIVDQRVPISIWGTSAAAPIAAAAAALYHQSTGRLLSHADLYGAAQDVTSGDNWNNALLKAGLSTFYSANAGFDLCTGAGSLRLPT